MTTTSHQTNQPRLLLTVGALLAFAITVQGGEWDRCGPDESPSSRDDLPARDPARSLSLPTDATAARRLEAARDYIQQREWTNAVRALQALLDSPEDYLVPAGGAKPAETSRWVGVRIQAHRLVGSLPREGRALYESIHNPRALALLTDGRKKGDWEQVGEVARRYFHTEAGAEAVRLLGTHHLDRGQFLPAMLCFQQLLERTDPSRLPPAALLAAAVAFHQAGDATRGEQLSRLLAARALQGLRLGERPLRLEELERELARHRILEVRPADWLLFGGDASRSARVPAGGDELKAHWQQASIHESATQSWLRSATQASEVRSRPMLPGFHPLVVRDWAIYRGHRGLQAVNLKTGETEWQCPMEGALDFLAADLTTLPPLATWVSGFLQTNPHVLYENATVGTLSSDGTRVYAVDDLAVPPYPGSLLGFGARPGADRQATFGPGLTAAAYSSRLLAVDVASGKLLWEVDGRGAKESGERAGGCFLGPPLPLAGQLFGVVDRQQELQLVCLEPVRGRMLWTQALVAAQSRLLLDTNRRQQALPPAYANGVLVCPTNAGVIVGLDLFTRNLLWAYAYPLATSPLAGWDQQGGGRGRRSWPRNPPDFYADWKSTAPLVREGRVIFSAPDGTSIHCLSLRDGSLQWQAPRKEGDLFLAGVHAGRVLVVGKQECRALRLDNGEELWKTATGLPSGQGLMAGETYYLPLRTSATEKGPLVLAIELDRGLITARMSAPGGEALGNLSAGGDSLLSQTITGIKAFGFARPRR